LEIRKCKILLNLQILLSAAARTKYMAKNVDVNNKSPYKQLRPL